MSTGQMLALFTCVLPLSPPGDPGAFVNVHWTYVSKRDGKTYWSGRACKSAQEMLDAVVFANRSPATRDVYFCLSSQKLSETKTINGRAFAAPIRSQHNASELKALYIDVDVKDGAYATQREALAALLQFVRDAGLPAPNALVSSGSGGLHVYWGLDQCLTLAEWQPLAHALAEATRRHRLKCDTACTVDGARILRVPGTLNRKREPNTVVELLRGVTGPAVPLAAMRKALAGYLPSNVVPLRPVLPPPPAALASLMASAPNVNDDLSAGVAAARPITLAVTATECGFIREALDTGGASYAYPLWNLTTLIATFSDGGSADAHAMAKGHPSYDPVQTEAQFQQKLLERERKNLGWPSCASIQNAGCGHCATCPHFAAGKSPLNFPAVQPPRPAAQQDDLPPRYMRDSDGCVRQAVTLENGATEWELVIPEPILDGVLDISSEPAVLQFATRNLKTGAGRELRVTTDIINATTANDLMKRLGAQAFMVDTPRGPKLKEFLVSYVKRLQEIAGRTIDTRPFGWEWKNGDPVAFAYGGVAYHDDGSERRVLNASRALARDYSPSGSIDVWKTAASGVVGRGRPDLELILATAFAAPLLPFTGENGAIVSAYSVESGVGKTTTMQLALSAWANPRTFNSTNDTVNAIRERIASLRNLPTYWDDVRVGREGDRFVEFVLSVSSGKGKSRLNRDGSQQASTIYETLLTTSSNVSLFDLASQFTGGDVAPSYRVFEFSPPPGATLPQSGNDVILAVQHHYGVVGQVYARYLGGNGRDIASRTRKVLEGLKARLQFNSAERFWFATAASILVGASLARQLGLAQFDTPALIQFIGERINAMRAQLANSSVNMARADNADDVLQRFLDYIGPGRVLVTNIMKAPFMRGAPAVGSIQVVGDRSIISREGLLAHRSVDDNRLMISKVEFDAWLRRFNYNAQAVLQQLEKRWGMRHHRVVLAAGTDYAKPFQSSIYYIDMNANPQPMEDGHA